MYFNDNLAIGSTPLDKNESAGLKLKHISTISELNEFENLNILSATHWIHSQKMKEVLTVSFLLQLHKKMLFDVWSWAGIFRTSDKNIGLPWYEIPERTKIILNDAQYWIDHKTYSWKEIGARLHHKLVWIHPFANGNGRHARLFCDALFLKYSVPLFNWGNIHSNSNLQRITYINALQAADKKNIQPLLNFLDGKIEQK
jgi:Fic-DOC domain mobile mystery protein B